MPEQPVDLVTVSREYGAGGSAFAKQLGERLGWPVLDYEIIGLVAERLNLQEGVVRQRDEQTPGWLERIASTLLISPPESPMQVETSGVMTPDSIAMAAHAVIVETAKTPPVIVVGHGAQCIFRDRPGTVQVRLTGSIETRSRRIVARDGGTEADAAVTARRIDAHRQAYVQRYYHHLWTDPTMFDAQFNT
ncbi:MAG: cytidylate kinase-like family protein, partial [Gemmatimonadaceae bacterium]